MNHNQESSVDEDCQIAVIVIVLVFVAWFAWR